MTRSYRVRSKYALIAALALTTVTAVQQTTRADGLSSADGLSMEVSVTTLEDYNSTVMASPIKGSLRYALEQMTGLRRITFQVGGEIKLCCPLYIFQPNITIDGLTAPAPGITLQRRQVSILNTHDIVLRNLRLRSGDGFADDAERRTVHGNYTAPGASGVRSLCIMGAPAAPTYAVTVENCSIQNSTDDNVSVYGNCRQILLRRCLISGGYFSHKQLLAAPPAGMSPVYYPDWLTIDSCVFTGGPLPSNEPQGARMPDAMGGTLTLIRNIVVWPHNGSRFTEAQVNVIGNWFVENPNHPWGLNRDRVLCVNGDVSKSSIYVSGNYLNGRLCPDDRLMGMPNQLQADVPVATYRTRTFDIWPATTAPFKDMNSVKGSVLSGAGCILPGRDEFDLATIEDTRIKAIPGCSDPADGDMNGDGLVDGLDLQPMVSAVVSSAIATDGLCHGDFNANGAIDAEDAGILANLLLKENSAPLAHIAAVSSSSSESVGEVKQ